MGDDPQVHGDGALLGDGAQLWAMFKSRCGLPPWPLWHFGKLIQCITRVALPVSSLASVKLADDSRPQMILKAEKPVQW